LLESGFEGRYIAPVQNADAGKTWTWGLYRPQLCEGCRADCCTLPVEVTVSDLRRMELISEEEAAGSPKKIARRLGSEGLIRSFRGRSGLFILEQRPSGDCLFLGPDRRCTIYEKRPDTCRNFPRIGPRPGYCPSRRIRG